MTGSGSIVRIAARGEGVTADGRHIPFAAPGDTVHPDGSVIDGPHHAVPPCRHFPECGGCQLQHVDDVAYARYVADRVAGGLAAQRVEVADLRAPHISPPRTRRRASLSALSVARGCAIGFHTRQSRQIVDMRECHVLHPRLFAIVSPLRDLLGDVLGLRKTATIKATLADQGVDLLIEGVDTGGLARAERFQDFASEHELARLALDDGMGPQTVWEPDAVTVTLSGSAIPLPPFAFLQATCDGEAALIAAVQEAAGGAKTVADLFCGLGTFAMALAGSAKVYAAEAARDVAAALKTGANRTQQPVFVEHRDLYRRPLTNSELDRFEAVALDPPRAGAAEQVAALAKSAVPRIGYVSCNPASFARDARTLVDAGYRLDWVQPVGQFRWSTHVELTGCFSR